MSFFIFLKQSVKFFRRSCGADAGGEIDPNPGSGDFRSRRASAFFAAFGGGRDAAGRQPGTRPSRGEGQKGVQDTPKDVVSTVAH